MIPLTSEPISITPTSSVPIPLTESQRTRMTAIEAAIGILNEAKVSFTMFASPDDPHPDMKMVNGQRLSYAVDLATISHQTRTVREVTLSAALKTFSVGFPGGLSVYNREGTPLAVFQDGKVIAVNRIPKQPQIVV